MIDYSNLELEIAVSNCRNMRDIFKLAKTVRYIWELGESINRDYFQKLTCNRIKQLACRK